jgi:ABC-2 type transport system ATP-binding protein
VLNEIDQVCDRVAVLVAGRQVFTGTVAELRRDPKSTVPRPLDQALDRLYQTPPPLAL